MMMVAGIPGLVVVGFCFPSGWCGGGLRVMAVVVGVRCVSPVMMGVCLRTWWPVAVAQSRGGTHCGRQRDDPDRAEKHHRASERRQRFSLQAAVPDPAGAHHDINLKQECA